MPCLDDDGTFHLVWTCVIRAIRPPANRATRPTTTSITPLDQRRPDLAAAEQRALRAADLQSGENGDPNTTAEKIISIPEGYSLINQAGMCLDTNRQPVVATWWAPGTARITIAANTWWPSATSRRVAGPAGLQPHHIDPVGTKYSEPNVRKLGRPVAVCDRRGPHASSSIRDIRRQQRPDHRPLAALRGGSAAHEMDDLRPDHGQSGNYEP